MIKIEIYNTKEKVGWQFELPSSTSLKDVLMIFKTYYNMMTNPNYSKDLGKKLSKK